MSCLGSSGWAGEKRMPQSPDSLRACMGDRRVSARWGGWVKTVVYLSILRDIHLKIGNEPISDRCGHLVKVVASSELVIGRWQEIEPLRPTQRLI